MADIISQDQEQQVKQLKRLLEGWRVAILPLKAVLLWEQQWHPYAIFGSISTLFLIIWLMDLNFLTSFALFGLIINFIDFTLPIVCNSFYSPSAWTGQKEKIFEEICMDIVLSYNSIKQQVYSFISLRESSPLMYYIISISMLCSLAWAASTMNNIFLVYTFCAFSVLWPGIRTRGIVNTFLSLIHRTPKTKKAE